MNEHAFTKLIKQNDMFIEVYIDPFNKRIRIDDYRGNVRKMIAYVEKLAVQVNTEKCIIIGKKEHIMIFAENDFYCEAIVDTFFNGSEAYYMTKYFTLERKQNDQWLLEEQLIKNVKALQKRNEKQDIPSDYTLIKVSKGDAKELAELYKVVFQVYPTPLHDFFYIEKTLENGTIYYAFTCNGKIVSVASAEVNMKFHNAELTDCATLTEHRKYGLMKHILEKLEEDLKKHGIYCAYSIARSQSFGMNAVLHQLGYQYRGRLTNNCYIYDKLENMNMWVKDLSNYQKD